MVVFSVDIYPCFLLRVTTLVAWVVVAAALDTLMKGREICFMRAYLKETDMRGN